MDSPSSLTLSRRSFSEGGSLAQAAQAAYLPPDDIHRYCAQEDLTACQIITEPTTDTRLFLASSPDCLLVSFRGTQDLRNWLTDLDCERIPFGPPRLGMEIHRGFSFALDSIWQRLEPRLAETEQPICFTGHSLGGALAMLAAYRWDAPTNFLCTFGQPRVGNKPFADAFNARLKNRAWRIVHAQDIVTRIPWLLNAYRHAGAEIFYDSQNIPHLDLPWWRKAPSDIFGTLAEWRASGRIAQIADHSIERYLEILSTPCAFASLR